MVHYLQAQTVAYQNQPFTGTTPRGAPDFFRLKNRQNGIENTLSI